MANKRVIELNERTQIDMNDWLLVDSSTSTRKLSIATLLSYFTYYSLIFVEELPTQDIQPNVVYLVPHSGSNTQWDEYIYINNDWSLIGVSTIDLSSIYQSKTDNNLQTTSKQIVGAINEVKSALIKGIDTTNIIVNNSAGTPDSHGTYTPAVDCFAVISYKQECVFIIDSVTVFNTGTDSNNAQRFATLPIKAGQSLEWYGSQYAGAFLSLYGILN